ncbi:mechanosensitive ion channel family protein [Paenibacillus sp. IB182496]|uniref:Mechanosensitive ion channel family protein n=1 Tax=Paenibacillus sabuli TaxID=2772509 RepID=A0A927GTN0_9BACL|nr:mechanosensitive ion channel family protein [Paenibacillus sabuli]MBD2848009.1 mechanosensitive ion channel family protein [Paenibacillus sabuli]
MEWDSWGEALRGWFSNEWVWSNIGWSVIRIVLILVLGRLTVYIATKTIADSIMERKSSRLAIQTRRIRTVGKLFSNIVTYVVYFVAGLLILAEFNVNLGPLLAGAGVVGLAIGFGAQSLVKDVITGFFIVVEDQFAIGDVVQTGTFKGTVEMIGMRSTRLKSWTGEVHIIPNGMINEVTNFSLNNSMAVIDISVAYEENIDQAERVIREAVEEVEDVEMVRLPEVLGVHSLGPSEVVIRIIAECRPNTQAAITRKLYAHVKKALDSRGIEIPYPKVVTYHRNGEGGVQNGA